MDSMLSEGLFFQSRSEEDENTQGTKILLILGNKVTRVDRYRVFSVQSEICREQRDTSYWVFAESISVHYAEMLKLVQVA